MTAGDQATATSREKAMKPNAVGKQISLNEGKFPFHYGGEAEQYTFYRIPKLLFSDPILRELSTDAKVLYGLMLDRMSLSLKNGWLDEDGRVFIYFSVEHIMELLDCGNGKCTKLLSELDDQNGIGLITRVRQGQGKSDLIYVHKCVSEISKSHFKRCENRISEDSITAFQEMRKSHANNIEANNTYFSENNRVFSEAETDGMRRMAERESYREMVMENIEYDIIVTATNRERLNEIVELIVDTICSTQDYIVIGGDKKPAEVVKSQFCKLKSEHIRFVLDSMNENTSRVRNIRKYLMSVLYNAPMTIDSYYSALVNHDLYGG